MEEIIEMDEASTAKETPEEVEEIIELDSADERVPALEPIACSSTDVDGTKATEAEEAKVKRRKGRPPRRKRPTRRAATTTFRAIRPAPDREPFSESKAESVGRMQLRVSSSRAPTVVQKAKRAFLPLGSRAKQDLQKSSRLSEAPRPLHHLILVKAIHWVLLQGR